MVCGDSASRIGCDIASVEHAIRGQSGSVPPLTSNGQHPSAGPIGHGGGNAEPSRLASRPPASTPASDPEAPPFETEASARPPEPPPPPTPTTPPAPTPPPAFAPPVALLLPLSPLAPPRASDASPCAARDSPASSSEHPIHVSASTLKGTAIPLRNAQEDQTRWYGRFRASKPPCSETPRGRRSNSPPAAQRLCSRFQSCTPAPGSSWS